MPGFAEQWWKCIMWAVKNTRIFQLLDFNLKFLFIEDFERRKYKKISLMSGIDYVCSDENCRSLTCHCHNQSTASCHSVWAGPNWTSSRNDNVTHCDRINATLLVRNLDSICLCYENWIFRWIHTWLCNIILGTEQLQLLWFWCKSFPTSCIQKSLAWWYH